MDKKKKREMKGEAIGSMEYHLVSQWKVWLSKRWGLESSEGQGVNTPNRMSNLIWPRWGLEVVKPAAHLVGCLAASQTEYRLVLTAKWNHSAQGRPTHLQLLAFTATSSGTACCQHLLFRSLKISSRNLLFSSGIFSQLRLSLRTVRWVSASALWQSSCSGQAVAW